MNDSATTAPGSSAATNPPPPAASVTAPKLFILRRQSGGAGGAEKVVTRFARMFGAHRTVVPVSAGNGVKAGLAGPGWWRALRFALGCDHALAPGAQDLVFSMERGPRCDLYRAGDGAHRRWLEIAYSGKIARWINPLHHVYPWLERRSLRLARRVVANSDMVARDLARFHPEHRAKIVVIRNGVDLATFTPAASDAERAQLRDRLGLTGRDPVVVFVGSGWARKGLGRAARLVGALAQTAGPAWGNARLLVLGRGDSERFAGELRAAGMTDRTEFRGAVGDVRDFLRCADLFVLPTQYDPCSNACIEALAAGCPVVTTANNGASELIRDTGTGIVLGESESDDAARVSAALRHGFLPSAEIAASVAHASLEAETAAYERLFTEILSERAPRS